MAAPDAPMTPRRRTAAPATPAIPATVKTKTVASLLDEVYGPRPWRRHLPPIDELVATILSQHTSDVNTERAFASLRSRFPTRSLAG